MNDDFNWCYGEERQFDHKTLNDASIYFDDLKEGDTEIWYADHNNPVNQRAFFGKIEINPNNLTKTHIHLGNIKSNDLEKIFCMLQGERWSPKGDARNLIRNKKLSHTSMSVGDVIKIDGNVYMVDVIGFKKLN